MFTDKNSYLFKSLCINYLRYKHKKYGKSKQVHISAGNCRKNPDAFPTPPIIQDKNKTPVPTKKKPNHQTRKSSLNCSIEKPFLMPNLTMYLFMIAPRGLKQVLRIQCNTYHKHTATKQLLSLGKYTFIFEKINISLKYHCKTHLRRVSVPQR